MKIKVNYVDRIYPNFTLIDEYVTMHTKTLIKCNKCFKQWSPTPSNFLRRIKCKFCENLTAKKNNITPEIVKLDGRPCVLYVLKLSNIINTCDVCLKIGITIKDLRYRLATLNSEIGYKYKIEVIDKYIGQYDNIRYIEKYILNSLKLHQYNIPISFSGETELLSLNVYNEILNIINKHGHNIQRI